ncbi:hypothetical protein BDD43_4265 [Mucilaginibacter gracilis]|uniref:Uncharacterized protein n=1 Tax=Mucilaginibacter gracilis TaxID=423350 RepID=A0A495J4X5_9SPHI|nr:hypothetical protein [Mucilaginibacter gracilis]RKR84046.1 hypothetical protein BDD43_4265 [Mucilaginibacter gracilis]
MNPIYVFWLLFAALLATIGYCNQKFCMLKDLSKAEKQPYSWSRVQLAWWTVIVLSAFTTIMIDRGDAPQLRLSTVILLGISAATIATARSIDAAEDSDPTISRHQDKEGTNFIIDILSDQTGVSIHRFQTVVFNLAFGVWFIAQVMENLHTGPKVDINQVMPDIAQNNLILLGLSSATYAALKTTENKTPASVSGPVVPVVQANLEEQPVG